jgi:hypothetical protein
MIGGDDDVLDRLRRKLPDIRDHLAYFFFRFERIGHQNAFAGHNHQAVGRKGVLDVRSADGKGSKKREQTGMRNFVIIPSRCLKKHRRPKGGRLRFDGL